MYTVYKHTAPNGKIYIGISKGDPIKRWNYGHGYLHNAHFDSAIKKYGWNNIQHEIVFEGLPKEEACAKEIELIAFYRSNDRRYGYNNSTGGENSREGVIPSEEYRKKLSKAKTGTKLSDETRAKISKSMIGKNKGKVTWNKGLPSDKRKQVLCVDTGTIYESTISASKNTGINRNHISEVCNGKLNKAGGMRWQYI